MIVKAVQGRRSIKVGRICWKGRFWAWSERVKEWWMMRVVMMTEMSWQVYEEVSRDMTGEADGMNQGVDSVVRRWMVKDRRCMILHDIDSTIGYYYGHTVSCLWVLSTHIIFIRPYCSPKYSNTGTMHPIISRFQSFVGLSHCRDVIATMNVTSIMVRVLNGRWRLIIIIYLMLMLRSSVV